MSTATTDRRLEALERKLEAAGRKVNEAREAAEAAHATWGELCVAADVDGASNAKAIEAAERAMEKAARDVERAELAEATLAERLERAREAAERRAYEEALATIANLNALDEDLVAEYADAARHLVMTAQKLNEHGAAKYNAYASVKFYADANRLPLRRPCSPLPFGVSEGYLGPDGLELLETKLAKRAATRK